MELYQYQKDIVFNATNILRECNIVYLSMQVRCGKTFTSLAVAEQYGAKNVLFVTKKKAISSIEKDFAELAPSYNILVTNYESVHKHNIEDIDLVIVDEAHCLGQFPKPANRTKMLKNICRGLPIIYLSGTPTPESYSQIYHQLYISTYSPFANYINFYKWAKDYVELKFKYLYNRQMNDYSCAKQDLIKAKTGHLFISLTQQEAGFEQLVKEEIHFVPMAESTYTLANRLKKDRVIFGKAGQEIVADTEVKLMQKLHQIYSGTVKTEDGSAICFDDSKVRFIIEQFKGQKIAIFYKFIAEFTLLLKAFGDSVTLDPMEFNNSTDKVFLSQIQSGREGINLSTADCLIMYNIDFSSVSYQQAKARLQTKDRVKECLVYWIFSDRGIEKNIYERVLNKKDFTLSYFKKLYAIK